MAHAVLPPAGHYAQAIAAAGHLYISGQLPITSEGGELSHGPFEVQVEQAIGNILAILAAAGGAPRDLVKVTAYIVDIANWPAFDTVYAAMLPSARPARTIVPVPELHFGYLVEIDAIAVLLGQDRNPSAGCDCAP